MNQKLKIVAVGYHNEKLNMAKVWLHAGEYSIPHQEAVMDISLDQVLLEQDLGIRCYLENLTEQQAENWKKAGSSKQKIMAEHWNLEHGWLKIYMTWMIFFSSQNEPRMLDRNK